MSIKNLTTDNLKSDQQLNVANIGSYGYSVQFGTFGSEDFFVGSVTVTTSAGYIRVNNVPSIAPGSTVLFTVNYAPLEPDVDCVLITGVQLGAAQGEKFSSDVHSIASGGFVVAFTNFATTNSTAGSVAFNYLIIKGFV